MSHRDELLADFQQFYGLALPDIDGLEPAERMRVAVLCAQLPRESRVTRATCPDAEWGIDTYFLRLIDYELRMLLWGLSDAKNRGDAPHPVPSPSEELGKADLVKAAEAVESAIAAAFNID